MTGPYVLRIVGMVNGQPTPYDDTYLVEFDPSGGPGAPRQYAVLRTCKDPRDARHYPTLDALHAEWTRVDPREPIRPDGKPNRPLTAFTVSAMSLETALKEAQ